jgi:hypothetical protein
MKPVRLPISNTVRSGIATPRGSIEGDTAWSLET